MLEAVVQNQEPFSPVETMNDSSIPRSAKFKVVNPFERALTTKKINMQRPRTETFDTQETATTANSSGNESPMNIKGNDSLARKFSSPFVTFEDTCSNKSSTFRTIGNASLVVPNYRHCTSDKSNLASNLHTSGIQIETLEAIVSSESICTIARASAIPLPRTRAENTSTKSSIALLSASHGSGSPRSSQPTYSPRSPSVSRRKSSVLRDSDELLSTSLTQSYSLSAEVAPTLNPSFYQSQTQAVQNVVNLRQPDKSDKHRQDNLSQKVSKNGQPEGLSEKAGLELSSSRSYKLKVKALSRCNPKSGCTFM